MQKPNEPHLYCKGVPFLDFDLLVKLKASAPVKENLILYNNTRFRELSNLIKSRTLLRTKLKIHGDSRPFRSGSGSGLSRAWAQRILGKKIYQLSQDLLSVTHSNTKSSDC